ncbi:MAG TPA: hypothetical protein VFV50_06455, partial [Bdellovibrionales bacterium]|nr:hypothetical protein [Bdellovibrionales bacterium]
MKTAIHLVSMPMASPRLPSIQLSALKTFLARKLGARATVRAHCAYLHVAFGIGLQKYAELSQARSELPMKTLFLRRFLSSQDLSHESAFADEQTLEALEHQITAYLDSHLGPALEPDSINVIGFTVNFHQVYSTLYAVQHLIERNPGRKMLFVFGGGSIAVPQVIALMKKLGIDAFAVLGEGENKLAAIAEACLSIDHFDREVLAKAIRDHRAGVFHVGDAFNLLVREPSWFKGQLESVVSDLDFSDYFQTLEHCFDDKAAL